MTVPALHRRSFITGLVSLVAAPAIVRAGSLMPVKVMVEPYGIGPAMMACDVMASERWLIDDCFLNSLFATLNRYPEMSATQLLQVISR